MARNFHADFLMPAIKDLNNPMLAQKIAIALDCAIAFGALERADGNPSLQDVDVLNAQYAEKVQRLKLMSA
jgi:hypothetical protein